MFKKTVFLITFFLIGSSRFFTQSVPAPNAQPYTIEGTYEKLKKKHPFIQPLDFPTPENIKISKNLVYKKIQEKSLVADVYYPKDTSRKYPGVVMVHGGGWISGNKDLEKFMAEQLAAKGFVAMAINYRLSDVAKYPAAVEDIQDAINWLKKNDTEYSLDKKKIAIVGESAGAQLATLVGVKNTLQAIVNVDGIVSFIHPDSEESTYAAYFLGTTKENGFQIWKEASPLEYVGKKTPPTIFINSSQPRFHAGRDAMIEILKKYKIEYEVHEIKDSPHSFWLVSPWFEETLLHTEKFLNKILKNK